MTQPSVRATSSEHHTCPAPILRIDWCEETVREELTHLGSPPMAPGDLALASKAIDWHEVAAAALDAAWTQIRTDLARHLLSTPTDARG
jgi:hypothetical protein